LDIEISPSNFRDSPSMTKDFYKYLEVARSGLDSLDNDLIYELFDWATKPFLPLFRNQEPGSRDVSKASITLQSFLYPETFDCEFTAVDDKFVPGHIQRQETRDAQEPSELGDDFVHLKSKLRSIHPTKIKICSDDPDNERPDAQPHMVRVDEEVLYFKSAHMSNTQDMINAIKKYLRIAHLGPEIRTSKLYGIVSDDNNPLIGLLLHYLDSEDSLEFAVESDTPETLKHQWATQITETLTRLHEVGIVWGDVKPDNVLIDKDNNAWIIDFEGGCTEGWVDEDKVGTVKGDLQGLANIVSFIFEEKKGYEDSDEDNGQ
jgi:hypothetical protein